MTNGQQTNLKVLASIFGLLLAIIGVVQFINSGVDERIDGKINVHERDFEMEQQEVVTGIKTDIATLKEQGKAQQRQLNAIESQGKHTQELVEQLIRER